MPRLFRLRNRSRADPGPVVPIPDHIRFQQDGRPDPLDPRTIPPQWRRLASLDPRSHDYDELLRTLVEVEGNRKAAMKATDKDAGIVINIIGEVSFCDTAACVSTTSYAQILLLNTRLWGAVDFRRNRNLPITASSCFANLSETLASSQTTIWSVKAPASKLKEQFSPAAGSQTFGGECWTIKW